MADFKTVCLTSATVEKMSRHDMLEWVNSTVHGQYKKIEELCSGVAYCQMMELLFPNCIGLRKIKCGAKLEHEFLHNLKLIQGAFTKLKFDKTIPIDRLIKGKFQDNFEFLQWFKKFFDTHAPGKENLRVPAAIAAAAQNAPKPIRKPGTVSGGGAAPAKASTTKQNLLKTPKSESHHEEEAVSPSSLRILEGTLLELNEQVMAIELERNQYYEKLQTIEAILTESLKNEEYVELSKRGLAILYDSPEAGAEADEAEEFKAEDGTVTEDL